MTEPTSQDLIDTLDGILEQERTALVHGQLDQLESLLEQKDDVISQLTTIDALEQDALETIQTKVSRNQVLLDSAMEGIRAVASRMQELKRVRRGLDIYDKSGRKTSHPNGYSMKLEKRA